MRILHIVGTISPAAGGPSEVIRMLVENAPPGYSSEVATLDDPAAPFLAQLPFKVHALGSAKKRWYIPSFSLWLAANCSRFDGVIVHGLWEYTGLAARLTLPGHTPYVVFPHGMLDPWFKRAYPAKHAKKWLYWLFVEYWNLRCSYRVLFTTTTERDLARQTFWPTHWTPQVTPIGCEPPPADTASLITAFQARCPDLVGKRFLLFLGRIDPKKGADHLLDAFSMFTHVDDCLSGPKAERRGYIDHADLHLVIAGPETNPWATDLRTRPSSLANADRVHWPGMILGDAKLGALAAAEAFILPSHQENFGVAVVEALAAGTPVLISDQVNLAPEIATDRCGYVEPDTVEGTLDLILNWMKTTRNDRATMSHQARQTFATRYDMRRNAESIVRIFESRPIPARAIALAGGPPMPRPADYNAKDHIAPGLDAYTRPAFSIANRTRRAIWNLTWLLLYRPSPRPAHGWRAWLLQTFGATLGPDCHFYPASKIWAPWNLVCEDHVAAADGVEIYNPSPIQLDSHVILSQGAYLCGATHDFDDPAFPLLAYRMHIERYAWICARACVSPGVNVGEGAVLGLASVATRDLAPWTVYSGHPAVAIRERQHTVPLTTNN